MERIRIIHTTGVCDRADHRGELKNLYEGPKLVIQGDPGVMELALEDGRRAFLTGNIIGVRSRTGMLERISTIDIGRYLSKHTIRECAEDIEGRYILVVVSLGGICEITMDRFGRSDIYYVTSEMGVTMSNTLDLIPASEYKAYDQAAIAHLVSVYGYRPPKKHTIYSGIHRLGVGETACINDNGLTLVESDVKPIPTALYGDRELKEYAVTFLDAVEARGSHSGNVVYLSSGWDSTAILACLVHIYGARKVRAVTGKMHYNERTGTINQFELNRAKEVADYYGVRLDISEFDYWKRGPEHVEEVRSLLMSQQMTGMTALNHMRLADTVSRTSGGDEAIFVGEISDGAHNLGFSQFITIFHPDLGFREYSDKMASYLFGPTFLGLLENGKYSEDPVYNLLRSRVGNAVFDSVAFGNPVAIRKQLLESFFLRNTRIPLFSRRNSKLLTKKGQDLHNTTMGFYLDKASKEITQSTLYWWYLHLYNSFHWQGSTVACISLVGNHYGLDMQMPFWDSRIVEFLSSMPEDWGRGLDLRPTKYPLKWMLKNRLDYPFHLQVGPHSYLYDVDPNFSHAAEILYGSSFTPYFKEILKKRTYENILQDDLFDMSYLNGIVLDYLEGQEVIGQERNDLFSMCMLQLSGDYIGDRH